MNEQAQFWQGDFGDQYLARNQVDWTAREDFWRHIQARTGVQSALEIGCSAGWNLTALRAIGVRNVMGIEINAKACEQAAKNRIFAVQGETRMAEFLGPMFDLTFTAGVLIHVAPDHLRDTMRAVISASREWVLAVEYAADIDESVVYRGYDDVLWKRPYGDIYQAQHGLRIIEEGDAGAGFDRCHYWLMHR